MKILRLVGIPLFISFMIFGGARAAKAVSQSVNLEYQTKANYLYNFTKFVTWSEDKWDTFNICILGNQSLGDLMNIIENRPVNEHLIKLVVLQQLNIQEHCHILFVSESLSYDFVHQQKSNTNIFRNTLLVGEGDNFIRNGGMISFVKREGKVKLKINLSNISKSSLKISAKLLEVADVILRDSNG